MNDQPNTDYPISNTRHLLPATRYLLLAALFLLLLPLGYWQGTAVGAQVQVPMFYDAHYLFPRPWTLDQAAPGVPPPAPVSALYGPNRISQPFVAGMDRLAMVRIWLAGPPGTAVRVSLSCEDCPQITQISQIDSEDERVALGGELALNDMDGRYYFLTFPAIVDSEGRAFRLTLSAPQATADAPVMTRAVGGDRLGGSIRLNEYPRPGNLALAAYGRGWPGGWWLDALGEQLLPDLFRWRLQQYKPALFKGAAFPALLGLMVGLTAVFLLLAHPGGASLGRAAGWGATGLLITFLVWQLADGRLRLPLLTPAVPLQPAANALAIAPPPGGPPRLVHDLALTLWTAVREPEARFVSTAVVDGLGALRVPPVSAVRYPLVVPPDGRLRLGMAIEGQGAAAFSVTLGGETVHEAWVTGQEPPVWADLDLAPWRGQAVELELATSQTLNAPAPLPALEERQPPFHALWLAPQMTTTADWLLAALPETAVPVDYRLGERVALAGYETVETDKGLAVTLYWRAQRPLDAYATVFVHLLDENGQMVAQDDAQPVGGAYPLPAWPVGVIIADRHLLPVAAPAGGRLAVGLYDPADLTRWTAVDAAGGPQPDGRILLELPR